MLLECSSPSLGCWLVISLTLSHIHDRIAPEESPHSSGSLYGQWDPRDSSARITNLNPKCSPRCSIESTISLARDRGGDTEVGRLASTAESAGASRVNAPI
ncbi:hypothetical protein DMENIID0001_155900 [Sergentomyia squamirostris]